MGVGGWWVRSCACSHPSPRLSFCLLTGHALFSGRLAPLSVCKNRVCRPTHATQMDQKCLDPGVRASGQSIIRSLAWLAARTTRPLLALEMLHAAAGLLPPLPTSTPAPSSVGRAGSAQLVQVGQRAADGLCRRGGGGRRRCALAAAHRDECSPHSGHAGGWRCLIVDGCTLLRPALQPLRIHVHASMLA